MTRLPIQAIAAFIGLDWADATHAICLQAAGSGTREASVLAHTPEAIDAWARALRSRFGGRLMAVCLELTKGPLVWGMFGIDVVGESTQLTSIGYFMVDYPPLYDTTLASKSAHVIQPLFHESRATRDRPGSPCCLSQRESVHDDA